MPPLRRKDERKRTSFDDEQGNEGSPSVYELDSLLYGKLSESAGPVIKMVDGNIKAHGFTLTSTGLQAGDGVTPDNWTEMGYLLFRLEGSIQWLLGDWLAYGMDLQWGDIPKIAKELGRDERLLHRYKQMATAFQYARRRVELTFGHHESVRSMSPEEQDAALAHAVEEELSVAEFRKWIRQSKEAALPESADAETPPSLPQAWTIDELEQWDMRRASAQERAAALSYIQQQRQRWEALEKRWRS